MLLNEISSRYPGLTLRVACRRWLARRPRDFRVLAETLNIALPDLSAWLRDAKTQYRVAANHEFLEALQKQKKKEKKKPGPKKNVDYHAIDRIKNIGADEYTSELLSERKRALAASAESPALT